MLETILFYASLTVICAGPLAFAIWLVVRRWNIEAARVREFERGLIYQEDGAPLMYVASEDL